MGSVEKIFQVITQGGVTYRNDPWHRECFTCTHCQKSLAGQRFTSRDDKPYCADCFGELFSKRCTACSKPITGKVMRLKNVHFHFVTMAKFCPGKPCDEMKVDIF